MPTILNGDIQVDYLADNRQKRMSWLGGTNLTYTMNELYSAMATLLDETTTIDSGTAFSAETPVEYTTGKIDSGDTEPWYVTMDLMEHITGGALRTTGWTRVTDTNAGIICVPVAPGGSIVLADEGYTVTGATTGSGTLLEFIDTGDTYDYLIIRPDSSAGTDDFTTSSQVITSARGAFTATQWATAASTTGEQIWANLYSIGTIDANVHLYIYQGAVALDADRTRVFSWNDITQDWYVNGHIDTVVALNDIEETIWAVIDAGYLTVFGRKYGDLFASFEVSTSITSGGRNPIPVQTSADLDNTTGIKRVTTGAFSGGPFTVGEIISEGVSLARGIVTAQIADTSIDYIPIDDPQIDFFSQGAQLITGASSGATATSSADAATGPATAAWFSNATTPTIAFTYDTADIDDDGTIENYAVSIDCQQNPLTEVYEWVKFAARNGEVTNDLDDINGERYIGGEVYLSWTGTITGSMLEGGDVSQATSLATGVIMAIDATAKVMLLRDVRGTFNTTGLVTDNDNSGTVTPDDAAVTFAPKTTSPLGSFAGGTFFGARGVLLTNYLAADTNSFLLIPIEGGTKEAPTSITLQVTNLIGGVAASPVHDRVSMFRLTAAGGIVNKTEYAATMGRPLLATNIAVASTIRQDTPGKATGGQLVLVASPGGTGAEYNLRYKSWIGTKFALAIMASLNTATNTTATLLIGGRAALDFTASLQRGDLLYNGQLGSPVYVKQILNASQLALEGAGLPGLVQNQSIHANKVPVVVTTGDDVYIPLLNKMADSDTESVAIIFVSSVFFRVKVRNTRDTTREKIKPFSSDGSTAGTDQSIAVVRTEDTIIT